MTIRADIWSSAAWPAGWDVRYVAETGSTNTDLLTALDDGLAGDRSVLATGHQTAGRGRLDRRWDAPPGANLLVSFAFVPVPAVPATATQRVGLAAVSAVRSLRPGVDASLKWPNDVLVGDRKLAGILAQRSAAIDGVVVGLGLNVGWAPEGAALVDPTVHPAEMLVAILDALDDQPADPHTAYRDGLSTLGRHVRIELPGDGGVVEGVACDVDRDGRLVVDTGAAGVRTFDVGDIVHLRTP